MENTAIKSSQNGYETKENNNVPNVVLKSEATFRIKKIEVKSNYAIDHVKITYDDDTIWTCGHDDGKKSNSVLIMTEGEYLVRVTHETFHNLKCAAASIEFETNKGRIFKYCPNHRRQVSAKRAEDLTTVEALPRHEIYGLKIRNGTLIGTHQQPVQAADLVPHPKKWYVILCHKLKDENIKDCAHYYDKSQAIQKYKNLIKLSYNKKGHGIILVDCIARNILKTHGDKNSATACVDKATELGFYARREDDDVSMSDVTLKVFQLLTCKKDIMVITTVILLLFLSFSLNLEASLLTGDVLTLVTSNSTEYQSNWYANKTCLFLVGCDGTKESYGKAIILAFLVVKAIENLLYVINVYIHQYASDSRQFELRCKGLNHILSLDQAYFDKHSKSEMRDFFGGEAISNLITWSFPYLMTLSLRFVMVAIYLLSIHFFLGLFAILCMIFLKFAVLDPIKRRKKLAVKSKKKIEYANRQIVDDVISMMSTVKMFSQEKHHVKELKQTERHYLESIHRVVVMRCFEEFGFSMISVTMFICSLFICLKFTYLVNLKTSELIGFFLLLQQFGDLYHRIQWNMSFVIHQYPDIERFISLMEERTSVKPGDLTIKDIKGTVEFDNVSFSYPSRPGECVLKGFNLKILPNRVTAIVGDSGAGKSTITKLLLRLYDPKEGIIKIDGHDLRTLALDEVHQQIGIVSQNPELFNLPLGQNIAYGTGDEYNEEKVEAAAKLSNCDFVEKFRGGFDTFAGAGGSQLSGGQKQRIAIARAFIRNPKILILDEATSSLDAENEKLVQDALEQIMKHRTVIVIAHRLSTVKNADEIICMKNGEAVERGTHKELMSKKNVYYNLVCRQTEGETKLKKKHYLESIVAGE